MAVPAVRGFLKLKRASPAGKIHLRRLHVSAFESFPRISPFLWFDKNAEEAVDFYLSVFKNSGRIEELRSPSQTSVPQGAILTISFELDGQKFVALNGGPDHKFNDAVSFFVRCDTQQEVDYYWSRLTEGGSEIACGWLRDRFGLCWQIVPARMMELIKSPKAMAAMMQMKKLDIAELERAAQA
jgi:predicted 3-demethylubiquinone-9 3-methyltransferase (glyoxalase superfamily)